jgi:hypothetical protein
MLIANAIAGTTCSLVSLAAHGDSPQASREHGSALVCTFFLVGFAPLTADSSKGFRVLTVPGSRSKRSTPRT